MEVYLDHAATTPLNPKAFTEMEKVFFESYGNPSSRHKLGIDATLLIKNVKQIIASDLKCEEKEICFTSGGTESNNYALFGVALANQRTGKHIISTNMEHAAVYNPLFALEEMGFEVDYLKVDNNGQINIEELKSLIRPDTILVSLMAVNNEVGAVVDLEKVIKVIKSTNTKTIIHTDAIQAYPKYRLIPKKLGIDLMSVSSHKFGGPKGCGFIYIRDGVKIKPIILGGGQQNNRRSGTENTPGIVGMGAALDDYIKNRSLYVEKMFVLKERFISKLSLIDGVGVNAIFEDSDLSLSQRVRKTAPHVISVSFPKAKSEVFLHALEQKGVYCSSGSACSSNHPAISGTLKAIGVKDEALDTTLRFTLGPQTTEEEIDYAVDVIKELLPIYMKFFKK